MDQPHPTCIGPSPSWVNLQVSPPPLPPPPATLPWSQPHPDNIWMIQESTKGSLSCKATRDITAERRKQLPTQQNGRALAGPGRCWREQGVTGTGWYKHLHHRSTKEYLRRRMRPWVELWPGIWKEAVVIQAHVDPAPTP